MKGTWQTAGIAGHPADIYTPAGAAPPQFAVLFLHGVGLETLRDNPAFSSAFDALGLGCISPITQRSWWGDRVCAEFDPRITAEQHLLKNVVPYFANLWNIAPPRIGLLSPWHRPGPGNRSLCRSRSTCRLRAKMIALKSMALPAAAFTSLPRKSLLESANYLSTVVRQPTRS